MWLYCENLILIIMISIHLRPHLISVVKVSPESYRVEENRNNDNERTPHMKRRIFVCVTIFYFVINGILRVFYMHGNKLMRVRRLPLAFCIVSLNDYYSWLAHKHGFPYQNPTKWERLVVNTTPRYKLFMIGLTVFTLHIVTFLT